MKQFVLPAEYAGEDELTLTGRDFHYLHRVRRLGAGDSFAGRGPDGRPYRLTVLDVGTDRLRLRVEAAPASGAGGDAAAGPATSGAAGAAGDPAAELHITLFQCLPKGRLLDRIVRQTVEAGVARLVPVTSAHAVKRVDAAERGAKQLARWRRIAEEAVQQSGRSRLPEVAPVAGFDEIPAIETGGGRIGLAFHEKALADHRIGSYLNAGSREVVLVVGPEGGLSDEEVSLLDRRGFNLVSLGPQVLRTETAALYAVAAVQSIYRELIACST
jgi:16S rRNA (uracil1498-N3)-methyltransferase